jgi:hypothetical protein
MLAERPLDELAGLATFSADKALCLDVSLPVWDHDDFDDPAHAAHPTPTVSLMEPFFSGCSMNEWPFLRAVSARLNDLCSCRRRASRC